MPVKNQFHNKGLLRRNKFIQCGGQLRICEVHRAGSKEEKTMRGLQTMGTG